MVAQHIGTRGRCRLCHALTELRHSHVISRLMFRPMSQLAGEMPRRFGLFGTYRPGHLKEYMLCQRCENQFSNYERITGRFLADLNDLQQQTGARPIRRSSLDYHNIRLFFLSLLWRCAVCHERITREVDLGSRLHCLTALLGDVLRSLSKKKMYGSPNSNPSPELGADKENHTSWERYYQVSDCSSSLRNDWYSGYESVGDRSVGSADDASICTGA